MYCKTWIPDFQCGHSRYCSLRKTLQPKKHFSSQTTIQIINSCKIFDRTLPTLNTVHNKSLCRILLSHGLVIFLKKKMYIGQKIRMK